ncbi:YesL family protein [Salisediminibacterium halotolerans]|uniref:YesL family protein n=1 Tax=Salisediminibacterium halotolerans TaxID=517425 RepID=UPI000EB3D361|nr:DUF624 domain-containing protein [Salisediminibacterium halotolerans]RLJ78273.1 putative membrane protein YesL [Actinophytocola xinjiangensis]RPE88388.1 putative membrane protein YesL [Salisediminibacterium halotolerans]TWG37250.1 putative membrane protein YesL [Salisediminibacterium halotolerans]GEL07729.1 hypothetical protein SHA02_11450 [Salisediminibacterium halotolerans]
MSGTQNGIYVVCDWLMRLALLNVIWGLFSLAGLGIFGLFPATVAASSLVKEWMSGARPPIFRFFFMKYKSVFIQANLFFMMIFGAFLLGILNLMIVASFSGFAYYFFSFSLLLMMILLILLTPGVTQSLMNGRKGWQVMREAGQILLLYPARMIPVMVSIVITYMIIRWMPGVIPFYSVNLIIAAFVYVYEIGGHNYFADSRKAAA